MVARAKRERGVQDDVKKANRRPTDQPDPTDRPDTAPLTPYSKMNYLRRKLVKLRCTPSLKINNFRRKCVNIGASGRVRYYRAIPYPKPPFLKMTNFRQKMKFTRTPLYKMDFVFDLLILPKNVKLRRTSY